MKRPENTRSAVRNKEIENIKAMLNNSNIRTEDLTNKLDNIMEMLARQQNRNAEQTNNQNPTFQQ